ncbi:MAG: rRNA adenine N-6-methyltransferase family protein [Candidatus Shikimatogenerans sp. Tduv]|uniref:rRNA adenine N-6-methyltransferase family protein n=1 Tax=Candidatus Shikimatogenerans sp. Tduv TaxID=3158567 RepID=A0AAU7QRS3_9FLAO
MNIYKKIKKKGQIFLINNNYVNKIINTINNNNKKDIIIEIGPGKGILTKHLRLLTNSFFCIETDKKLVKYLKNNILSYKDKIINLSILNYKLNFNKKVIIVGNIPYYITQKILYWILKYYKKILFFVLLLQKEVAYNILLKNKKITKLSIILQIFFHIKFFFNIKNTNFRPIPKVHSTLLKFIPKKNTKINIKKFIFFIKKIFKKKRKKIYNSLNLIKFKKYKIFNKRIEELSLKKIILLYKFLLKKKCLNQDM